MNLQCCRELRELGSNEFGRTVVKLNFGNYFRYFDANLVAYSLQLQLNLDANCIPDS